MVNKLFAQEFGSLGCRPQGLTIIEGKTFVETSTGEMLPLNEGQFVIHEGKNWTLSSAIEVCSLKDFKEKYVIIEPLKDCHGDETYYPPFLNRFVVERIK